jgi:hypothetical protein
LAVLDPAIYVFSSGASAWIEGVDGRIKSGHDG